MGDDPEETQRQVGAWLRAMREKARLSQDQAGAQLGVSPKTVGRWERGVHPPSGDLLLAAAKLYGADLGDIMSPEDMARSTNVPRGAFVSEAGPRRYRPPDDDSWSPNPALANKIPQRAYEVAIGYCRRLQSAGVSREGIEEIERLMIDERYIKANKRLGRELSEDDLIMLIDRTFDAVKEAMSWKGLRV